MLYRTVLRLPANDFYDVLLYYRYVILGGKKFAVPISEMEPGAGDFVNKIMHIIILP